MIITLKTAIPFRKRTTNVPGETIRVRDSSGRTVETWECVDVGQGRAVFNADGYRDVSSL